MLRADTIRRRVWTKPMTTFYMGADIELCWSSERCFGRNDYLFWIDRE